MSEYRRFFSARFLGDHTAYTGKRGELTYYQGALYYHDGATVGGQAITGGGGGGSYTLPTASTSVKGGVKVDGTSITIDGSGVIGVNSLAYSKLTGAPTIPNAVSQLTNDSNFITLSNLTWNNITSKPNFSAVATSGSFNDLSNKPSIFSGAYADLTGKPTLFSGAYADLTGKPTLFSGAYADLTGKPNLATVATTGSYNDLTDKPPSNFSGAYADLTGKPTLFSGNYNDLTNKPTIPAAQVNSDWNALTGAAQILNKPTLANVATTGSYTDLTNKPTLFSGNYSDLVGAPDTFSGSYTDLTNKPNFATVATSGSYSDLTNRPSIPSAQVQTDWNAVSGMGVLLNKPTLASVATSGSYNDLTNKPTLFSGAYADLSGAPELFSGNYNDLTNKPSIPSVPTNISAFTNDSGYATESWVQSQGYGTGSSSGFSGNYNDLSNLPNFGNITFNGDTIGSTGNGVDVNHASYSQISSNGSYVWVENGNANIEVDGNTWNFQNSNLTVPGHILAQEGNDLNLKAFNPTSGGVTISLQNRNIDTGNRTTQVDVAPDNIVLTTDFSGAQNTWTFDNAGTLTTPGGIVPAVDNTVDLGSPTNKFRHLYVGAGTIYIGDVKLSSTSGNLTARRVTNPGAEDESDQGDAFGFSGGSGATNLYQLSDVSLDGPSAGQVLTWNGQSERWENQNLPGNGSSGQYFDTVNVNGQQAAISDGTTSFDLVAGDGISITAGSNNQITISATGSGSGSTLLPPYKGFRAHYGSMYGNDSDNNGPINKLVIYQDTVTPSSTISSNTDDDQFTVSGLSGSNIVAMLVVISDNVTQTATEDLKTFVQAIIDNVILNNGQEGNFNNVDDMKIAFYNNFNNFNAIIPSVKTNFQFLDTNPLNYNITDWNQAVNSGSGSGISIGNIRWNPNNNNFDLTGGGNGGPGGYQVGDTITIPGTVVQDYQGNFLQSPDNDITVTINNVDGQGIAQSYTITGTVPYTTPGWPTDNISDGGNDEYDNGNYIDTNLGTHLSYNSGMAVYGDGNVGGGDYVATYQSGIFGFFTRGANIDSIGTSGNSGFDGSGTAVTGGLYGGASTATTPVIEWTNPNNNVWRIEEYNGGAAVSYNGNDYDAKWFDVSNSTSGNGQFRGAIIQYHAFVQNEGNIIGTIHLANDYTQQQATHTENMSGNGDLQYVTLWDCNNERGQLFFKMTNGNSKNVMIQWTAKVFYGSENNC